ncbi:hypothetical protein CQW23_15683 [Capsicum baccatum]|uniref:Uncharacterized protein n=1 Tax=Capsicum baccatum TaxID=33114 RepID=A0A2G2WMQ5_CAPBA|nr:hypothetical protein CQW23_15683 [Capsicum baccatum]PHU16496.1 hypothetical protein BC332_17701 [Capsicum chinense]
MAWPLLSVWSCYCVGVAQVDVSVKKIRAITSQYYYHSETMRPFFERCRFSSGDRIRTRFWLLNAQSNGDYGSDQLIEDLRVPQQWLQPSKALEESEWLQTALNKWLDDEYCPEETNIEISKVAASSFYRSLLENKTDIGEILLKMAEDLESISYQESFHGAFSSANAAVNLIIQRLEQN